MRYYKVPPHPPILSPTMGVISSQYISILNYHCSLMQQCRCSYEKHREDFKLHQKRKCSAALLFKQKHIFQGTGVTLSNDRVSPQS